MSNRTTGERIASALRRLETEANIWIATASSDGVPHLIPLSLAWMDSAIVVTTPTESATVRNAIASGRARAALDSGDDVVIVDSTVTVTPLGDADPDRVASYIARVGWDPRAEPGEWSLLTLAPIRVQAWNSVSEINGRTIMRDGAWLGS